MTLQKPSSNSNEVISVRAVWLAVCSNLGTALGLVIRNFNRLPIGFRPLLSAEARRAAILSVVMLLLAAIGDWSYNFYVFTRIVVTLTLLPALFQTYSRREILWSLAVGMVAILFNPVDPFHFSKDTWGELNWVSAAVIAGLIIFSRPAPKNQHPHLESA